MGAQGNKVGVNVNLIKIYIHMSSEYIHNLYYSIPKCKIHTIRQNNVSF